MLTPEQEEYLSNLTDLAADILLDLAEGSGVPTIKASHCDATELRELVEMCHYGIARTLAHDFTGELYFAITDAGIELKDRFLDAA